MWEIITSPVDVSELDPKSARSINAFAQKIEHYREELNAGTFVDAAKGLLDAFDYESELKRRHPDPQDHESRWRAVEEVINSLGEYEQRTRKPDLNEFLNEMTIMQKDTTEDKDKQLRRNAIVLMTLHAAKGLEFPHVYMVGMEENLLPHHRSIAAGESAIEEERRLCYVGVTRAEEYLTLSLALTRRKWGRPRPTTPSRFLFEITGTAENPAAKDKGAKNGQSSRYRGKTATG